MNNILVVFLCSILSITGQFPTEFNNEVDSFEYNGNYVDDNTLYSNGYYMDANDFSIPSDKLNESNMDILSGVKVWDKETGEELSYDKAKYEDESVTYTYKDMSLTVNYEIYDNSYFSIIDASSYILQATYFQILPIIITSIITIGIIALILFIILKVLNKLIENLLDIF